MTPGVRPPLFALLMGVFGWAASALADEPPKPQLSAEERAQKQADRVFTFIRLHSEKPPAKRAAPVDAAPAAAAAAAVVPAVVNAQAKASPKPPNKPAAAVETLQTAPVESKPSAPAPAAEPPAALLAAASPSAASVQPELLPQPPARPAEPEPPALQLLSKVEPEIPRQLQADFRGGSVTLRFMVQTDGSVAQAQALQSSHKRLTVAAIAAVNQWRFAPLPAPREATVDIAFAVE